MRAEGMRSYFLPSRFYAREYPFTRVKAGMVRSLGFWRPPVCVAGSQAVLHIIPSNELIVHACVHCVLCSSAVAIPT